MKKRLIYGGIYFFSLFYQNALADEHMVGQEDMKFSQERLIINVGDTVVFRNDEEEFHNVFSLSDTQTFDLGSYPKGESREVVFEKAGIVEVECAMHPSMQMIIEVKD